MLGIRQRRRCQTVTPRPVPPRILVSERPVIGAMRRSWAVSGLQAHASVCVVRKLISPVHGASRCETEGIRPDSRMGATARRAPGKGTIDRKTSTESSHMPALLVRSWSSSSLVSDENIYSFDGARHGDTVRALESLWSVEPGRNLFLSHVYRHHRQSTLVLTIRSHLDRWYPQSKSGRVGGSISSTLRSRTSQQPVHQ